MYTTEILSGSHAARRREKQDHDHWDQYLQEKLLSADETF